MYILPRIKELRLQNNYSQQYVAKTIGVSLSAYRKYESVDSSIIRLDVLEQIAMLYDTKIRYLLDEHD
jgi:transcriptional regulator with XRE-family HTH domain